MLPWETSRKYWIRSFDSFTKRTRLEIGAIRVDDTSFTIISETYGEARVDTIHDCLCCTCDELLRVIRESTWEISLDIMSCDDELLHKKKVKK